MPSPDYLVLRVLKSRCASARAARIMYHLPGRIWPAGMETIAAVAAEADALPFLIWGQGIP